MPRPPREAARHNRGWETPGRMFSPGRTRFIIGATIGYVVFATLWIVFSDKLLMTVGDVAQIAWLSTAKGIAFVAVTGVALAAALRHVARHHREVPVSRVAAARRPWPLLTMLGLVAMVLAVIATLIYRGGSEALRQQELDELRAVADLKVTAISRWLDERQANERAFARDPAIVASVNSWQISDSNAERSSVLGALSSLRRTYGFTGAQLLYSSGEPILADGQPTLAGARLQKAISEAQETGNVVLVDLYRPDEANGVRLGLVAELAMPRRGAGVARMLIALELRPDDFLYPLIDSWPTPDSSGEAALVRREWGDVVYLSNLQYQRDSALKVRFPLGSATLPAAKLLLGQENEIRGTDYRGIPVLAAGAPVPGTTWFVLTKINEEEALRPVRRLALFTAVLAGAALLFAATFAGFVWQRQRLQAAFLEMQQRAATAAAELRFHATFDQAPMGLAHLDLEGRWLRVNRALWLLAGYDQAGLLALRPAELAYVDAERNLDACMAAFLAGAMDRCQGERLYRRPDGRALWLEMSLNLIRAEDGAPQFFVLSLTDVTERKAAEIALQERVTLQQYLEKIAKTVPGMIYSYRLGVDGSMSMPYVAPNLADIFHGLTPAEAAEDAGPILARVHPDDLERLWAGIHRSAATLGMWNEQFRVMHPLKGALWVESRAAPEREADGSTVWHGFIRDVTAQKHADEQMRQAAAVFGNTQEGVVITDRTGRILRVNPAVCGITGYSEQELVGNTMRLLRSGRHDATFYDRMWAAIRADGFWQGEIWNRRKGGDVYPELLTISTVRDGNGAITNYVGTFTDITYLKQSEQQLERLAHHDALTGLPNRLLLLSRLEHALERTRRNAGIGAVLFVDLDRFKNVNDSLGHPAGDELLIAVARRLRARLRDTDTLARLGGDEFVVILEEVATAEKAAGIAQELINRVSESFQLSGDNEVYIGASIGISMFPSDGEHAAELIQHADTALYEAKEAGKRTYRFYRAELTEAANARLDLEARLRRGLDRGELVLHYQPLVALDGERVVGVEALLRWNDPERGLIPPGHFIPLAEETGLIVPMGEWVLREACRQVQAWRAAGLSVDSVAVNLASRQFLLTDIADRVRAILAETGLPPRYLELEITESTLMHSGEAMVAKLAELKALGIRLAIDDFGTGYSSLSYLKRFPIDKLKVDKSFVRDIPADTADSEITAAIIGLGKTLQLEVLAEGVETPAQLAFLRQHGCDTAQGYLFSRPLPPADLEKYLAESARRWTGGRRAGGAVG